MENVLLTIFIIFVGAKVVGELFERLGLPVIVGEILLGVAIAALAPFLLAGQELFPQIAELGVILLLFVVGLETKVEDLLNVGAMATAVAVMGVIVPFALGFGLMEILGYSFIESIFLATAMVATSVGITARVLSDLGVLTRKESRIILGAAVVDDVLGLIVLAVVTGVKNGSVSVAGLAVLLVEVAVFIGFFLYFGTHLTRKHGHLLERLKIGNAPYMVALGVCLGIAVLAEEIGLAAIVGAFLAGVVFAEVEDHFQLKEKVDNMGDFLVPFFFVMVGTNIHLDQILRGPVITLALAVTVLAIVGKFVGCGIAGIKMGYTPAARVAVGMIPRGEVGIIVALMGSTAGAIGAGTYASIVFMSIATTLVAPFLLRVVFKGVEVSVGEPLGEAVEP